MYSIRVLVLSMTSKTGVSGSLNKLPDSLSYPCFISFSTVVRVLFKYKHSRWSIWTDEEHLLELDWSLSFVIGKSSMCLMLKPVSVIMLLSLIFSSMCVCNGSALWPFGMSFIWLCFQILPLPVAKYTDPLPVHFSVTDKRNLHNSTLGCSSLNSVPLQSCCLHFCASDIPNWLPRGPLQKPVINAERLIDEGPWGYWVSSYTNIAGWMVRIYCITSESLKVSAAQVHINVQNVLSLFHL